MFSKDPADLCLTPETTDEALWQVGPGGIVVVKALWGDWAYVYIRVYSIPAALLQRLLSATGRLGHE